MSTTTSKVIVLELRLWSLAGVTKLNNPQVQCPHCDHHALLDDGFSYLAAGCNGVNEGDPDDVHLFECGNCKQRLAEKYLQWVLVREAGRTALLPPDENRLMCARALFELMGEKLAGRTILTWPAGEYPGGKAKVVQMEPDKHAEEIVFEVVHPSFTHDNGRREIGVFEWELVQLFPDEKGQPNAG